jgi:hypothetical protein
LIKLAANADSKLAVDAARTLSIRLPDPALDSTNGFGGFPPFTREARRPLVRDSWDAKLAPSVRSLATNYLAHSEKTDVSVGAYMLQAVGTTNEAPAVRAALDRVLDSLVGQRRNPNDNILDQPEGIRELLGALNVLHSRGYTVDENGLSGQGAFLLYFTWLAGQPPPRPARWLELLNVFGENCRYPVRVAALNSIPDPVPDDCLAFVESRLADEDLGVVRTACAIAGRSGRKSLVKPLIEIIATEHHEWLLREATDAATKLGAGIELLDAWADRLSEESICGLALQNLDTIIERKDGSCLDRSGLTKTRGDRLALRRGWKDFLARHADDIRSGKKFNIDDPALTPALVGRPCNWGAPK